MRLRFTESLCVQTCLWAKKYGFTPNLDFNPLFTKFNFTLNFCIQGSIASARFKAGILLVGLGFIRVGLGLI